MLYAFRAFSGMKSRQLQGRLKKFSFSDYALDAPDILRRRILSNVPFLNKIFFKIPGIARLDKLLQQANAKYPVGVFILLSLLLMQIGFLIGNVLLPKKFFFIPYISALFVCRTPLFLSFL